MSVHRVSAGATATALSTIVVMLVLTGCGPKAPAGSSGQDETPRASAAAEEPAPSTGASDEPAATGTSFPGTGTYRIGTDIPYGGYQLHGEPSALPAGCTWSILGTDGAVVGENNGLYAFLTDVPEYVTFQTDGCPDWEKFE